MPKLNIYDNQNNLELVPYFRIKFKNLWYTVSKRVKILYIGNKMNEELKFEQIFISVDMHASKITIIINEINAIYIIDKKDKIKGKIKIFGDEFVKNNKNNCRIMINKKQYSLRNEYKIINYNKNKIKIKLIGIRNITNMSCIFAECETLYSLPDISKWNTRYINNMSFIFYNCKSLKYLSDISKWDTSNVINFSGMFYNCESLSFLPDISKWNTNKLIYMGSLYWELSTLSSKLTDLENSYIFDKLNWNSIGIFCGCKSLTFLPDISKWDTSNVKNMSSIFSNCESLLSLPDISKWNTSNVIDMSYMFFGCKSLSFLPDISKWNTSKAINMKGMFEKCYSLNSLIDISKWNVSQVINFDFMFHECMSLPRLPDISECMKNFCKKNMFYGCINLMNIPSIYTFMDISIGGLSFKIKIFH